MWRPCVTCKDPVRLSLCSATCASTTLSTQAHVYFVCPVTASDGGGEQVHCRCCWTYRNWSVECLIDQMRQPWGDWLSQSFSHRSLCDALSLLCLFVGVICFFYSEELFLLKLSALNLCTELERTNWPWRTYRELHVLIKTHSEWINIFYFTDARKYLQSRASLLILSVSVSLCLSSLLSILLAVFL